MTSLVIVAVAACAAVLVPRRDASLARLQPVGAGPASASLANGMRRRPVAVAAMAAAVALWSGGGVRLGLLLVAGGGAVILLRRMSGLWRLRRARERRRQAVISVCDALAAELRGGLPAGHAVARSCDGAAELAPVVTAARLGGNVAHSLRRCAELPGAEGLRAVAAAWEVAGSSGAALAGVLERVAAGLRSDEDARAEVAAALGPPRATAKMLAGLPLVGIAMGVSMGADPVSFLLRTPWGLGCLSAGILLALVGLWWVEALASSAER